MRENNKRQLPICMLCSHPEPAEISMWKTWVGRCWVYHTPSRITITKIWVYFIRWLFFEICEAQIHKRLYPICPQTNLLTLTLETKWRKAVVFNFLPRTLFASSEKFQGDLNFALRLAVTNIASCSVERYFCVLLPWLAYPFDPNLNLAQGKKI